MTVAVYTPTCRPGGLDVLVASLERQHRDDLVWIVGDELFADRASILIEHAPCPVKAFDSSALRHDGMPRTLSAANNRGLEIARDLDADLLVFLNDYIWAPAGGIDAFERMADEHPRAILTGATSISNDPPPARIADPAGLYTIFDRPYTSKPRTIGWEDCRLDYYTAGIHPCNPVAWEANWAALPPQVLHDPDLNFDEAYDRGHYYDNQAFAIRAQKLGYDCWMDCDNHAISLPHKAYFPEQQTELEGMNNREFHENRLRDQGFVVR